MGGARFQVISTRKILFLTTSFWRALDFFHDMSEKKQYKGLKIQYWVGDGWVDYAREIMRKSYGR